MSLPISLSARAVTTAVRSPKQRRRPPRDVVLPAALPNAELPSRTDAEVSGVEVAA